MNDWKGIIGSEEDFWEFSLRLDLIINLVKDRYVEADRLQRVGIILARLVSYLDEPSSTDYSDSILNVFQRAITLVSEEVSRYTKVQNVRVININEESEYIRLVSDIREELSMIKRVLSQQEDV